MTDITVISSREMTVLYLILSIQEIYNLNYNEIVSLLLSNNIDDILE